MISGLKLSLLWVTAMSSRMTHPCGHVKGLPIVEAISYVYSIFSFHLDAMGEFLEMLLCYIRKEDSVIGKFGTS